MCGRSLGSLQGVPNPATGTPLLNRGEVPALVVPQELRSVSLDSELLALVMRARCLLCDSYTDPVSSVCRHSQLHSYLHSNRHLSDTRLHWGQNRCADTNTHRYTAVQHKRSESHCDGAYLQPQWDSPVQRNTSAYARFHISKRQIVSPPDASLSWREDRFDIAIRAGIPPWSCAGQHRR